MPIAGSSFILSRTRLKKGIMLSLYSLSGSSLQLSASHPLPCMVKCAYLFVQQKHIEDITGYYRLNLLVNTVDSDFKSFLQRSLWTLN